MRIYTYQATALVPGIFRFWFGAAYELRLVSYVHKTVSYYLQRRFTCLVVDFWGFCGVNTAEVFAP